MAQTSGSGTSSPDPLASSFNETATSTHPPKPMRAALITPKKSAMKANGNIRLQDFYLTTPPAGLLRNSSPTKSIAQTENLLSPWRIHVTVEAEKDEPKHGNRSPSKSPTKKATARTKTTTIPLKGADDSSPMQVKKSRGRPRKSLHTRIATPGPKKSMQLRKDAEAVDDNPVDISRPKATSPKKGRGRPRKSLDTALHNGDIFTDLAAELQATAGSTPAVAPRLSQSPKRTKPKGRRNALTPRKSVIESDTSMTNHKVPDAGDEATAEEHILEVQMSDPPVSLSANDEANKSKTHHDPTNDHQEFDSIMESEGFSMVSVSSLPSAQQRLVTLPEQREPTTDISVHAMYRSRTSNTQTAVLDPPRAVIVEASALPASSLASFSRLKDNLNAAIQSRPQPSPSEVDNSSRLYQIIHQRTPSEVLSSPALPAPPQPLPHTHLPTAEPKTAEPKPAGATPKLARVVRAGIALQGVLNPVGQDAKKEPPKSRQIQPITGKTSPKDRLDDLFSGFGAGTRRELRAGLRLGEQLAKRQHVAAQAAAMSQNATDDVLQETTELGRPRSSSPQDTSDYSLTAPGVTHPLQYPPLPNPQLPSPEGSEMVNEDDAMSWKADIPDKQELTHIGSELATFSSPLPGKPSPMMIAREAEWQREREAVSRQVEEANSSQVIIIDNSSTDGDDETPADDDEDAIEHSPPKAGEETIDIWQCEAQQSSQVQIVGKCDGSELQFPEEFVRPRRSKLPSPWRRNKQVVYSDDPIPVETSVAWHQDLKHTVTPQESVRRKRVRYDAADYSVLSEFIGQPDDESSQMFDEDHSMDEIEEDSPSKKIQASKILSHAQYPQKRLGDIANNQTLGRKKVKSKKSSAPPAAKHNSTHTSDFQKENDLREEASPCLQPPPKTWLSRITSFVPRLQDLIPTISSTAILPTITSSKSEPTYSARNPGPLNQKESISVYQPWTVPHYRALKPLYLAAKRDKKLYPYNPHSPSAWLLGRDIFSLGWKKVIEKWELGVVDAFLDMLDVYGVNDGELDKDGNVRALIDEREVINRVFSLWVGEVQRQETSVGNGTVGIFDPRHEWRKPAVLKAAAEGR
ncbi:hypothetical protein MMC26_001967 [Xylographa opegraphella]|nr:hypothetical protein [Xylographa opegraphella]